MRRFVERLNTFTDWRRDYFLTLIYTGARRGEIAAIRKEQFRKDEETGRYYIFIADGKTEHAQRQIPVSRTLEALLVERVKTSNLLHSFSVTCHHTNRSGLNGTA